MDISTAERQIAVILSQLERETGSVVRAIEVTDIEVTKIDSVRREMERRISIDLERLPGTHWGQAQ